MPHEDEGHIAVFAARNIAGPGRSLVADLGGWTSELVERQDRCIPCPVGNLKCREYKEANAAISKFSAYRTPVRSWDSTNSITSREIQRSFGRNSNIHRYTTFDA